MKRTPILLALLLFITILCSCELAYNAQCPAPKVGKVRILVYGNDFYGTGYTKLSDAVNDAYSVGKALSALCEKAGYEYETVFLLSKKNGLNESEMMKIEADRVLPNFTDDKGSTLFEKLNSLVLSSSEADVTFLYFSTHGDGDKDTLKYGENPKKEISIYLRSDSESDANEYKLNVLKQKIEDIKGTKIVITDFCFSGGLVNQGNVSVQSGAFKDIGIWELYEKGRLECYESSSTYVLSAARYNEKSWSGATYCGNAHGFFTAALLKALGWNDETMEIEDIPTLDLSGRLTLQSIAEYTRKNDGKAEQTPMTNTGSADIVLFEF